MKLVTAIVDRGRWGAVCAAVKDLEVRGVTVAEVRDLALRKKRGTFHEDPSDIWAPLPRLRLEVAVPEAMVESVIAAIVSAKVTPHSGHGKIVICGIQTARRAPMGGAGDVAL